VIDNSPAVFRILHPPHKTLNAGYINDTFRASFPNVIMYVKHFMGRIDLAWRNASKDDCCGTFKTNLRFLGQVNHEKVLKAAIECLQLVGWFCTHALGIQIDKSFILECDI